MNADLAAVRLEESCEALTERERVPLEFFFLISVALSRISHLKFPLSYG